MMANLGAVGYSIYCIAAWLSSFSDHWMQQQLSYCCALFLTLEKAFVFLS